MVLRWNANTAFADWKIKDNLKKCLDISGGTWLSGDLAQAPVAFEFGKKGSWCLFCIHNRLQRLADGQWQKGDRGQNAK